ncbi:MAG TPA: Crp/Fnr family transcriptional regulator [Firmicutes bacterium]|nr:Crp/Fnr family transcriptional regulator [Bacillota bacterium]
MLKILTCIDRVPIFSTLSPASVNKVHSIAHHRHYEVGETVFTTGDAVDYLMVLISGALRLSRTNKNGREQIIRELGPGEFYGELALFAELQAEGDLYAIAATDVCMMERKAMQEVLRDSPQVAWSLLGAMANRLAEAERLIANLSLLDVTERLVAELLRLAETGEATASGVRFTLPITWAQLATKLGTTPESLSRRLKQLNHNGLVTTDGRHVHLLNLKALQDILDDA